MQGYTVAPAARITLEDMLQMPGILSYLTDAGFAELWVHGHVHQSINLIRPGGIRIVCNPGGPGFGNPDFQDDLVVEV